TVIVRCHLHSHCAVPLDGHVLPETRRAGFSRGSASPGRHARLAGALQRCGGKDNPAVLPAFPGKRSVSWSRIHRTLTGAVGWSDIGSIARHTAPMLSHSGARGALSWQGAALRCERFTSRPSPAVGSV